MGTNFELRAMVRWAFYLPAFLFLALFVASTAVWIRSQFRRDTVWYCNDAEGDGSPAQMTDESINHRQPSWSTGHWNDYWELSTDPRGLVVTNSRMDITASAGSGALPSGGCGFVTDEQEHSSLKFWPTFAKNGSYSPPNVAGQMRLEIPYWLLVMVFSIAPILALVRIRRERGLRLAGQCTKCEYDLRSTPHRCPECGCVPKKVSSTQ